VTPKLKSKLLVTALVRAAQSAGGAAMVLRKGDEDAGSVAVTLLEEGRNSALFERQLAPSGGYKWHMVWHQDIDNKEDFESAMIRRTKRDPDLWLVELSVPNGERFIAEWPD
jgi:hypothetical protein